MKILHYIMGGHLLLSLIVGACGMVKIKSTISEFLPDSIDGWEVVSEDQFHNRKSLYEYINGGAELYLSYGFSRLVSRTYSKPEQPDILVDFFDMRTSRSAYGVFSYSVETVERNFGQGSQQTEGALLYWKDHYLVYIFAWPETPESKSAIFSMAKKIEAAIPKEGALPKILALLPREELVEESIRYFQHYIWLNSHYFISDQNILHIDDKTEALLANYGGIYQSSILLLVQYRNEKSAKIAYSDFAKNYLPELLQSVAVQIEDGTWAACQLSGDLLAIVLNAPSENTTMQLLKAVQKKILISENRKKQRRGT